MKRVYLLLSLFWGLLSFSANAQNVSLRVDSIYGIPDTVHPGQILSYSVILKNNGFIPYQGPLQLAMDNGQGQIAYLYFSASPVVILPGATHVITNTTVTIDSSFFRPGNNVVVVWPYTSQLIQYTPHTFTTFVATNLQGINEPSLAETVQLYPNPANTFFQIDHAIIGIERVRIFDLKGRVLLNEKYEHENNIRINLEGWRTGLYSVEINSHTEKTTKQLLINSTE
ncbi:MAG: T9SS type A sorting domain-containing protein [Bacteroidota bacterium]